MRAKPAPRPQGFWPRVSTGTLPMAPALAGCAAFFAAAGVYGLALGGHFDDSLSRAARAVRALANVPGFAVASLRVTGASHGKEREVVKAVGAGPGDPILWLDTAAARRRVEALPWVKSAAVLRLLPATIEVRVEERAPYAIWQQDGTLSVIDADGVVISRLSEDAQANLPLVVGSGANTKAKDFLALLENYPELRARMHAAVRVADRRWNIRLVNGMDIRLPPDGLAAALDELFALDREHGLLAREISAVDLRLSDRITVRQTGEAAMRRPVTPDAKRAKPARQGGNT